MAALSVKRLLQRVGERGFAGAGKPCQPDDLAGVALEALAVLPGEGECLVLQVLRLSVLFFMSGLKRRFARKALRGFGFL